MEQLHVLVREKTKDKQERSHQVAAEIIAGIISGSKYWTLEMVRQIYIYFNRLKLENTFHLA
jgi:hypothetical protein